MVGAGGGEVRERGVEGGGEGGEGEGERGGEGGEGEGERGEGRERAITWK